MEPVIKVKGKAIPLDKSDVDTDVIIPAEYLKRPERTGWGEFAFAAWRKDPDFILNDPTYTGAPVLISGPNFGCGSSREHAVWAIKQMGVHAIIAPSFGDIFRNNAGKNGVLTIALEPDDVRHLMDGAAQDPPIEIEIDLPEQTVTVPATGFQRSFEIDPYVKHCLLEGLDDITATLREESAIRAFEKRRSDLYPVTR